MFVKKIAEPNAEILNRINQAETEKVARAANRKQVNRKQPMTQRPFKSALRSLKLPDSTLERPIGKHPVGIQLIWIKPKRNVTGEIKRKGYYRKK